MITSRRELHNLMEKAIDKNLRLRDEGTEYPDYAVKTNIIEANCGIEEISHSFSKYKIEIRPTKDKFLYIMIVRRSDMEFILYLDCFFKRFWKLYSIEESTTIRRFIDHFVNNLLRIDSLWMPHQMLDSIESNYVSVGFTIKFKQEVLREEELSGEEVFRLTMKLWSKESRPVHKVINLLREHNLPVTKTSTRLLYVRDNETKFLDEVWYDGKVSITKGTEIEEHIQLVDSIIDAYTAKMTRVEENRIYLEPSKGGFKSHGHPFELKFSRSQNIKKFSEKIINSTGPFRLWGMVHDEDESFLRIAGVDTHTGDTFNMDLMPDYARVYLPRGACGNVIFRLYTNIQQSLDAGVTMCDGNGAVF